MIERWEKTVNGMADDFNWNNDEAVVIAPVDAVAVYTNAKDGIVIRQNGGMDEDNFVVIPRGSVEALITGLRREAAREGFEPMTKATESGG